MAKRREKKDKRLGYMAGLVFRLLTLTLYACKSSGMKRHLAP